ELHAGELPAGDGDGRQRFEGEDLGEPGPSHAGVHHLLNRGDDGSQAIPANHDSDVHLPGLPAGQPAGASVKSNWQVYPAPSGPSADSSFVTSDGRAAPTTSCSNQRSPAK